MDSAEDWFCRKSVPQERGAFLHFMYKLLIIEDDRGIAEAIQTDQDYESHLKKYGNLYKNYKPNYKPYFKTSFSPGFIKWCNSNEIGTSIGNGAMMRISPIGFSFDNEHDVKENARLATIPSHNSKEAINSATTVALIIYYFRQGLTKEDVFKKLDLKVKYVPFEKFNMTCHKTIDNCLYALYESDSFEEDQESEDFDN